jgi:glycerol-3-phosphate dehydrogenase (NAD(P)+)
MLKGSSLSITMKQTISILGAGSWGTTLAVMLAKKDGLLVSLWSPFKKEIQDISSDKENRTFLPGVKIPDSLNLTCDLSEVLPCDSLIIVVPVEHLRSVLRMIKKTADKRYKKAVFLSVMKGIEIKSFKRPSEIMEEELGLDHKNIVVLSGPTIAKEVAAGLPSAATVASPNIHNSRFIQRLFQHTALRLYTNDDLVGVEIASALKNVIAVACGISDGLGFGSNAKSAIICRGLREMMRFGRLYKAKEETFWGISGLGDLCTTCFSPHSRNRTLGEAIGKGQKLSQVLNRMKMVAEGVSTVRAVYRISRKYRVDMPISREVYHVLYQGKSPTQAVKDLVSRPLKAE